MRQVFRQGSIKLKIEVLDEAAVQAITPLISETGQRSLIHVHTHKHCTHSIMFSTATHSKGCSERVKMPHSYLTLRGSQNNSFRFSNGSKQNKHLGSTVSFASIDFLILLNWFAWFLWQSTVMNSDRILSCFYNY